MEKETKNEVNLNNLKPLKVTKSKGIFKTFTNGSILENSSVQPYLGKPLSININEVLSTYPSEDNIGTQIHSYRGATWRVLEEHDIVVKRLNENG
jgi:hypothetical protein